MNLEGKKGIEIAGFEIADHVLARIGWILPLFTVTLSMLIHALSGDACALPFFISVGQQQTDSSGAAGSPAERHVTLATPAVSQADQGRQRVAGHPAPTVTAGVAPATHL